MGAAAKTFYLLDAAAGTSAHGSLQDGGSAPGVSTTGTGWATPSTTSGSSRYSNQVYASVQATGTFGTTQLPNAAPTTTNCWRSQNPLIGSFVPGTWTVKIALNASASSGATETCGFRFRAWRSTSQDGQTSVTEITTTTIASGTFNLNTASATHNLTATWSNAGQKTFSNEYLFFEIALVVGASTSPSSVNVKIVQDGTNSVITTPVFAGAQDITLSQFQEDVTNTVTFNTQYAGNTNVVFLGVSVGTALTGVSCSDTAGNTYEAYASATDNVTDGVTGVLAFAAFNIAGSSNNAVTVNYTGTPTLQGIAVMEYVGPCSYDALKAASDHTGTSTAPNSGNFSTNQTETLVSFVMTSAGGNTYSPGSGYSIEVSDGTNQSFSAEDGSFASGSRSGSFTLGSGDSWSISLFGLTPRMVAAPAAVFTGSGTLLGAGALTGSSAAVFTGSGTLLGAGALAGSSAAVFAASGTLLGAGALVGSSAAVFSAAATLSITGQSNAVFAAAGTLLGAGALAGESDAVFTAAGTLQLFGQSAAVFSAAGTLLGAGALAGQSSAVFAASGNLEGLLAAAGESDAVFSASATVSATAALAGESDAISAGSGTLLGAGALAGESDAVFTAAGTLQLFGSSAAAFAAQGTLGGAGELDASSAVVSTASGSLEGAGALASESDVVFTGQATLLGAGALSGESDAVFSLVSTPSVQATSTVVAMAAGVLLGVGALTANPAAAFAASGTLLGAGALTGSSAAVFTATGDGQATVQAVATSNAVFTASATAGAVGILVGSSAAVTTCQAVPSVQSFSAAVFTSSGTLLGAGQLVGDSAAVAAASGTLLGSGFLSGHSQAVFGLSVVPSISAFSHVVFTATANPIVLPLVCTAFDTADLIMLATDVPDLTCVASDVPNLPETPLDTPDLDMVVNDLADMNLLIGFSPMGNYFPGQNVDLSCAFTDPSGNPYVPTIVSCTVVDPTGNSTVVSVSMSGNVGSGVFTTTVPGVYTAKWVASGGMSNRQGIDERTFYCQPG